MEQQRSDNGQLWFDLWVDGYWCGMARGDTITEARESVRHSYTDPSLFARMIVTPYYGRGTSKETYQAVTGRQAA